MILRLIRWSLDNRFLVLAGALALAVAGVIAVLRRRSSKINSPFPLPPR